MRSSLPAFRLALLSLCAVVARAIPAAVGHQDPILASGPGSAPTVLRAPPSVTAHHHFAIHVHSTTRHADEWCQESTPNTRFTGYFETPQGFYFFAFFESRSEPAVDPFLLWVNGGPGCSSMLGLLMELGPCRVNAGGNSTSFNPYAWNNKANLLFLDQPIDVGFSFAKPGKRVGDTDTAAEEVDIFFQIWFFNFPQYAKAAYSLFGESYAGHYIPSFGRKIHRENGDAPWKNPNRIHVNLNSIGIGNAWVRPLVQYDYFAEFLVDTKYGPLISEETYASLKRAYPLCKSLSNQCERHPSKLTCVPANTYCESAFGFPAQEVRRNPYDVRQQCEPEAEDCYAIMADIDAFLNLEWVQQSLGVSRTYEGCSSKVSSDFFWTGDGDVRYDVAVAELLEVGVRVLVYAGDADFVCCWQGNEAWLNEMEWSGRDEYLKAPKSKFLVGEATRGEFKTAGNLTWLVIYEAGHMVPYDRPVESLEFLLDWIK
ncbi:Alpha/Beta hydrolase protein [Chytriomyces sp. MP71]|nr:Alpha/Beta hydrolase protein [Chytriomyces sp. MP71]